MLEKLPTLRMVMQKYNLTPNKKLGQNFLLDQNITDKIAGCAGDLKSYNIIEIGPGLGGLTRSLLLGGAKKVFAIEIDPRCIQALRDLQKYFPDQLEIIEDDVLSIDIACICPQPCKVVANLPYNIATPILLRLLDSATSFTSLTLMFQKEVAERLLAQPKSSAYGRLSVYIQWLAEVSKCFDLPPQAFIPPPKVYSTVVSIIPRPSPLVTVDRITLQGLLKVVFGHRRKMLRSSLKSICDNPEKMLAEIGISSTHRPEELTVEQFCSIAMALE